MLQIANRIYYPDHIVTCDINITASDRNFKYVAEMAKELSVDGSAADHKRELDGMNNDGTWTITKVIRPVGK